MSKLSCMFNDFLMFLDTFPILRSLVLPVQRSNLRPETFEVSTLSLEKKASENKGVFIQDHKPIKYYNYRNISSMHQKEGTKREGEEEEEDHDDDEDDNDDKRLKVDITCI